MSYKTIYKKKVFMLNNNKYRIQTKIYFFNTLFKILKTNSDY